MLVAAGMFETGYSADDDIRKEIIKDARHDKPTLTTTKIVLSTRFSFHRISHSDATQFTKALKEHEYVRQRRFKVYAPQRL